VRYRQQATPSLQCWHKALAGVYDFACDLWGALGLAIAPGATSAPRWRRDQGFLCALLDCPQVAVNRTARCRGPACSQLVYLTLQLPVFFDQLRNNRIELLHKLPSAKAPRSASWHSCSPPLDNGFPETEFYLEH